LQILLVKSAAAFSSLDDTARVRVFDLAMATVILLLDQSILKSFYQTQDFANAYDSISKGDKKDSDKTVDTTVKTTPTTPNDNAQLCIASSNTPQAAGTGRWDRILSFGANMSTK
jgi:hypothetical protein